MQFLLHRIACGRRFFALAGPAFGEEAIDGAVTVWAGPVRLIAEVWILIVFDPLLGCGNVLCVENVNCWIQAWDGDLGDVRARPVLDQCRNA